MNDATVSILLTARDEATPKLQNVSNSVIANKAAFRELAMGVTYLGTTFLGLGIAMEKSKNESTQAVGHFLSMAGGIMTAVGSAAHFVTAVGSMINALNKLRVAEMLTQAFSGPTGWVSLGVGAAVAGATIAGVSAYSKSQEKTNTNIHIYNQGSVITHKQLVDEIRTGMLQGQERDYVSGLR